MKTICPDSSFSLSWHNDKWDLVRKQKQTSFFKVWCHKKNVIRQLNLAVAGWEFVFLNHFKISFQSVSISPTRLRSNPFMLLFVQIVPSHLEILFVCGLPTHLINRAASRAGSTVKTVRQNDSMKSLPLVQTQYIRLLSFHRYITIRNSDDSAYIVCVCLCDKNCDGLLSSLRRAPKILPTQSLMRSDNTIKRFSFFVVEKWKRVRTLKEQTRCATTRFNCQSWR